MLLNISYYFCVLRISVKYTIYDIYVFAMFRILTQRCREINIYCRGIAQQALSGLGFEAFGRVVVKNDLLQVEGCQRIISMFCKQGCVTEQCQKLSVCWSLVNSIGARRAMMSSVSSSQLQLRDSTLQVPGSSDRQFLLTLFWSTMVVRHLRRHATGLLPAAIVTIAFVAMVGQPKPSERERSISDCTMMPVPKKRLRRLSKFLRKKKTNSLYDSQQKKGVVPLVATFTGTGRTFVGCRYLQIPATVLGTAGVCCHHPSG